MALCGCKRLLSAVVASRCGPSTRLASAVLHEFFDEKEYWGKTELNALENPGRSWTAAELRGKGNADLHKLWFVLLKERNMLLTMQQACHRKAFHFPNPERIDFVEESMGNLEKVVSERNAAVLQLERGDGGRAPTRTVTSMAGFQHEVHLKEHLVPSDMNTDASEQPQFEQPDVPLDAQVFQKLWRERQYFTHQRDNEDRLRAKGKLKRYYQCESDLPDIDVTPPQYG